MSDIEIGIDVGLTCDDCGAVLEHKKVRMSNLCAEIEVYRCKYCREVEQREYREDHYDVINELEKQITRLIDELRQAKPLTYSDIDAAVESGKLKPGDMPGCPKDTDGDGNCGRPACPVCGTNEANAEGESRSASARTLHPLVGHSESRDK